jgi:parvulin-like peptidyl-prolyl isomerase
MNRRVAIVAMVMLVSAMLSMAADIIDGVVAIVNDKVITYSQVMTLVQPVDRELRRSFSGKDLEDQRRKAQMDALNTLIERALIVQEFNTRGFKIPDTLVEQQITDIIANEYGGNRAAFIKTLEAENLTLSQFRDQERERVIIQAMRNHKIQQAVIVSPYKLEKYYQEHIDDFKVGEQIKLRMIFIKRGETAAAATTEPSSSTATNQPSQTNSEANVAATNVETETAVSTTTVGQATLAVTNATESVATNSIATASPEETNALTLAKQPTPAVGSPLPTVVATNVAETTTGASTARASEATTGTTYVVGSATTNPVAAILPGETNTMAATPSSETNTAAAAAGTETNAAAVAAPVPPAIDVQRKLTEEILAKLDAGDSFESMARVYSDGKEAKDGGDWGWVGRDILRKELNEIAFSLKPGQHSRLIDTSEGYYILEVEDVKPAHITPLADVRDDIEKTLLEEEHTRMQEDWVKDLRAKAYIRLF